jgi:hypothetical protein
MTDPTKTLVCASCDASPLKPPRLVGGAWYSLCTECLFETEIEQVDGSADTFRVKGVVGLTPQQEADLRRPTAQA